MVYAFTPLIYFIFVIILWTNSVAAQMFDLYGGYGSGMYGGYNSPAMYGPFGGFNQFTNPMLYGGGGAMMGNPLLAMDYGASMGGMNGFLGGLNPMLGANGFGMNSFGLMNPTDPMMGSNLGSGLSMGNPIFGTATNSNNFGSVGSPFGRQFRRYSSGGIGRDSEANKSPTPGCGFLMKRGCNDNVNGPERKSVT